MIKHPSSLVDSQHTYLKFSEEVVDDLLIFTEDCASDSILGGIDEALRLNVIVHFLDGH